MARTLGSIGHCNGLTDKEVETIVSIQYEQFCKYRKEIKIEMPDRRNGLFHNRIFNGSHFEIS